MNRASTTSSVRHASRAFTLTELLVVMGVIAVLSVLTLVSVRAIINDARLSSATNVVTAALDNARALAMKNNRTVLMVFRPRLDGENVVVDIVACQWTGESYLNEDPAQLGFDLVVDRFVPISDAAVRSLPAGIKVAAPSYVTEQDDVWVTQSHLPATVLNTEVPGVVFGVMFAPDGTSVTGNAQSDASLLWADFFVDPDPPPVNPMGATPMMRLGNQAASPFFIFDAPRDFAFEQRFEDDEPFIVIAPFLAVYDDKEARTFKTGDWNLQADYVFDLTGPDGYISENANRVHFNRYTGVVMR